jgi:hypothetical protein
MQIEVRGQLSGVAAAARPYLLVHLVAAADGAVIVGAAVAVRGVQGVDRKQIGLTACQGGSAESRQAATWRRPHLKKPLCDQGYDGACRPCSASSASAMLDAAARPAVPAARAPALTFHQVPPAACSAAGAACRKRRRVAAADGTSLCNSKFWKQQGASRSSPLANTLAGNCQPNPNWRLGLPGGQSDP